MEASHLILFCFCNTQPFSFFLCLIITDLTVLPSQFQEHCYLFICIFIDVFICLR